MTIYHYRCSLRNKCGARKTLKRPIEKYIRRPKCPRCHKDTLKFDPSRRRERNNNLCKCDGMEGGWPHRKGSSVWCHKSKKQPTEEDYLERYGY